MVDKETEKLLKELDEAQNSYISEKDPLFSALWHTNRAYKMGALVEIFLVSGFITDTIALYAIAFIFNTNLKNVLLKPTLLFSYLMISTFFILLLVLIFQTYHSNDTFHKLSFKPSEGWKKILPLSLVAVPVLLITMILLKEFFVLFFPQWVSITNPVLNLIHSKTDLALFMLSGIIAGGIREEIQRAFIIKTTEIYFWSPYVGLFGWSIIFGLEHAAQGTDAIFITAILGMEFGFLYILKKNVTLPIISHALFNTIVLMIYWFIK